VDLVEVAPGSWTATWRLAPGRAGMATASGALADEPGLAAAVQLPRAVGALAKLSVQAAGTRVSADGAVLLRVVATDGAGNPVEAAPKVEATLGEISKLVPVAPGTWETRLAVPPRVGAIRRLQLVARAGAVEGRSELEVAAGPPVTMDVSAEPTPLVGDGGAAALVRVLYRDRFGNPADGPAPEVEATRRASITAEPEGPGAWVVRYRPPRAWEDREDVLSVRAGALEGAARLGIVAPERRLGVAPKVGIALGYGGLRAPFAAAEATYRPTSFARRLAFALELEWLSRDRTDAAQVGDVAIAIRGRARYLPVLCTARWELQLGAGQALWAVAGGGAAHVRSEVSTNGGPAAVEQGFVTVVHAGAGWALRRGHGGPFVEARVARHGDPQFEALRGSLTALMLAVGYRYDAY
jgi:hypothetical protein